MSSYGSMNKFEMLIVLIDLLIYWFIDNHSHTMLQVEALIFKYDKDADGRLSFIEFAAFWDVQIVW